MIATCSFTVLSAWIAQMGAEISSICEEFESSDALVQRPSYRLENCLVSVRYFAGNTLLRVLMVGPASEVVTIRHRFYPPLYEGLSKDFSFDPMNALEEVFLSTSISNGFKWYHGGEPRNEAHVWLREQRYDVPSDFLSRYFLAETAVRELSISRKL